MSNVEIDDLMARNQQLADRREQLDERMTAFTAEMALQAEAIQQRGAEKMAAIFLELQKEAQKEVAAACALIDEKRAGFAAEREALDTERAELQEELVNRFAAMDDPEQASNAAWYARLSEKMDAPEAAR